MPNEKHWTPEAMGPGLTVNRLPGQSVAIANGNGITVIVQVIRVQGKQVCLRIAAPAEMKITRSHYVPAGEGPGTGPRG